MSPSPTPLITLNRGFPNPGYVWSPFVTKLEFRLRHSSLSYHSQCGSISAAPKGKIPWIQLTSTDGTVVSLGDSTLITKQLVSSDLLVNVNEKLDEKEKLVDLGVRALLEDKLYFYHTRERWLDNYYTMRDHILSSIPYPLRVPIGYMIYRKQVALLHAQGTLRYDQSELAALRREIWETISGQLLVSRRKGATSVTDAKGCFYLLGGDHPTEADFTLFGFISSVLVCTSGPESRALVKEFEVLLDYAGRIHRQYFPDYEKLEG